jgi:hypothetical protein
MLGGVASAVCDSNEYIISDQACVGDVLVLTKPLGTQVPPVPAKYFENLEALQDIRPENPAFIDIRGYPAGFRILKIFGYPASWWIYITDNS